MAGRCGVDAWFVAISGIVPPACGCHDPSTNVLLSMYLSRSGKYLSLHSYQRCGPRLNRNLFLLMINCRLSLIGYDAITHMTEEMPRPTRDAPIAMLMCVAIGGVT
jgi:choline transport protein